LGVYWMFGLQVLIRFPNPLAMVKGVRLKVQDTQTSVRPLQASVRPLQAAPNIDPSPHLHGPLVTPAWEPHCRRATMRPGL